MDKISSILPANPRVTSVDLRNSGVARPGTPAFGREIGMSSVARRQVDIDTKELAKSELNKQMFIRNKESDPKAAIIRKMANDFFIKKNEPQISILPAKTGNPSNQTEVSDISNSEISDLSMDSDADLPEVGLNNCTEKNDIVDSEDGMLLASSESSPRSTVDEDPVLGKYLDVRA